MNSLKRVRAFQIELEFGVLVFKERRKPEYPEKNQLEQGRILYTYLFVAEIQLMIRVKMLLALLQSNIFHRG